MKLEDVRGRPLKTYTLCIALHPQTGRLLNTQHGLTEEVKNRVFCSRLMKKKNSTTTHPADSTYWVRLTLPGATLIIHKCRVLDKKTKPQKFFPFCQSSSLHLSLYQSCVGPLKRFKNKYFYLNTFSNTFTLPPFQILSLYHLSKYFHFTTF